jgi:hypothetical protein
MRSSKRAERGAPISVQRFAIRRGAQLAGQSILSSALGCARGPALRRGGGAQVRFAGSLTEGTLLGWLGLHVVNLAPATRRELHRYSKDYSPRGFPAASSVWLGCWDLESNWSGRRDSNPRPRPWQGRALPLSYTRIRDAAITRATGRAMPNAAPECNSPSAPEFVRFDRFGSQIARNGRKRDQWPTCPHAGALFRFRRLLRGVTRAIRPRSTPVQPLATDGRNQLKFACNPPLMQENF